MTSRRAFLARLAQQPARRGAIHDSLVVRDSSNLFAMDQNAARTVSLPPKPGAGPSMSDDARDELEHHIRCQCGCTLDVFTCRTTDFSCRVSPAMHRDIMELVKGGHSAQEIIDAFVGAYGERARMAPTKSGFNLLAWFTPGLSVLVGGAVVFVLLRRWKNRAPVPAASTTAMTAAPGIDATADELARLDAAVRADDT